MKAKVIRTLRIRLSLELHERTRFARVLDLAEPQLHNYFSGDTLVQVALEASSLRSHIHLYPVAEISADLAYVLKGLCQNPRGDIHEELQKSIFESLPSFEDLAEHITR
jgi:hypothetical protein